jgi:hypothetical protein
MATVGGTVAFLFTVHAWDKPWFLRSDEEGCDGVIRVRIVFGETSTSLLVVGFAFREAPPWEAGPILALPHIP